MRYAATIVLPLFVVGIGFYLTRDKEKYIPASPSLSTEKLLYLFLNFPSSKFLIRSKKDRLMTLKDENERQTLTN